MKRLYVRSHTPKIVLVATYKDEKDFQCALLHLSAFPLQAFLYETQKRELRGNELEQELTALIAYAKKIKKEFWCIELDEEKLSRQKLDQRISSTPTVKTIWGKFQKVHQK